MFLPDDFDLADLAHPDQQFRQPNSVRLANCKKPEDPYAYITAEFSARLFDDIPAADDI